MSQIKVTRQVNINGDVNFGGYKITNIGVSSSPDSPVRLAYPTTTDPGATNDGVDTASIGRSFSVGDFWANTTADRFWICIDNTTSTAIWKRLSPVECNIDIAAGEWDYPSSNPAPLENIVGTNGKIAVQSFDDTTPESVEKIIMLPNNIDPNGTVTFYTYGFAQTPHGTNNKIQWKFYHSAKNTTESWDVAYSDKSSGDLVTYNASKTFNLFSFTETVTTLGWASKDHVRIILEKIAPSGTALVDDYYLSLFRMNIPLV